MQKFCVHQMHNFLIFFKNWYYFFPSPFLLGVIVRKNCRTIFWDTLYNMRIVGITNS